MGAHEAPPRAAWNGRGAGRESLRQARYRQALYLVEERASGAALAPRRRLSDAEAARLFEDIACNRTAGFGLAKLAGLDLDERFPLDAAGIRKPQVRANPVLEARGGVTLLEAACLIPKRDGIIKPLVVARCALFGAGDLAQRAEGALRREAKAAQVWLIRHVVRMTLDPALGDLLAEGAMPPCEGCGRARHVVLEQGGGDDALSSGECEAGVACVWPTCGCQVCHACAMEAVIKGTGSRRGAAGAAEQQKAGFCCPACNGRQPDDVDPPLLEGTPAEVKAASLAKLRALPVDLDPTAKPKFRALPRTAVARQLLSSWQGGRQPKLWKAALRGDCLRAHWIVHEGVDVDAQNEYGQTALHIAAWKGHADVVALLLRAGAEPRSCNQGFGPRAAALANGHDAVAAILPDEDEEAGAGPAPGVGAVRAGTVQVLIPPDEDHPGAGAFFVDDAFPEAYLEALSRLCRELPCVPDAKATCSERRYVCDSSNWISDGLEAALNKSELPVAGLPHAYKYMRFLCYQRAGMYLAPHVDLSRTDERGLQSTHTFILYLDDCAAGGATALLREIPSGHTKRNVAGETNDVDERYVLAAVAPRRGRLLVFPHICPHEGRETVSTPKSLLRGELGFVSD